MYTATRVVGGQRMHAQHQLLGPDCCQMLLPTLGLHGINGTAAPSAALLHPLLPAPPPPQQLTSSNLCPADDGSLFFAWLGPVTL